MKVFFTCGRLKPLFLIVIILLLTVGISSNVNATDYYSRATGNWNNRMTWSLTSGGAAVPNGSFPASGPGAGDNVYIEVGTVTMTSNPTISLLTIEGGTLRLTNTTTNRTLTVSGNVSIISGTISLTNSSGDGTLNVAGNFSATGGTLTTTGGGGGAGFVVFNKSGTQTYTSGTTITNTNFTVNSGSILQMAAPATVVTGTSFTLSSGATLGVTSAAGITTAGATGNIQTTTRTYAAGANYIYNGSANQAVGNGLTQNTPANLTI